MSRHDKAEIARQWTSISANRVNESMVWLFLNESTNAMNWFLDKADDAGLISFLYDGRYLGEPYKEYPGTHIFIGKPYLEEAMTPGIAITGCLYDNAVEMGVPFDFETAGEQFIQDEDGRITGVIAKTADGYVQYNASKEVILATDDISGNEEMTRELCPIALTTNYTEYR